MEKLNISILGRPMTLSCPEGQMGQYLDAVKKVDVMLEELKTMLPNTPVDRLAIMGCIQLSLDMGQLTSDEGPLKGVQWGEFEKELSQLNASLDENLAELASLVGQ